MDLRISDKVALVAASSQGLGKAVALGLAREGAKLVLCSRNEKNLEAAKNEIQSQTGGDILTVLVDLMKPADIKKLVTRATETFETIHILVNNAGGPPAGVFWDLDDASWQKGVDLTLMSSVRLTREILPLMRKQKWGRIINITSVSVKQPIDELLLSNSLRLSVVGWAKTLANQVASEGILINNVCPGWTRTDRVEQIIQGRAKSSNQKPEEIEKALTDTIPMGRLGKPEELADLVVFLASERASYITGTSIQVDGGAVKGIL
ncbi:SDR family oxidoreductase [candidate division KSB1 bacterium]|nr:SDR family oxidoreductase [candidate division KSB1 bacterium]NIR71469.1 SDR family oxidoreductase [candidate division KSB1 bacterium]NIS23390.1 SDR family oxidoreductase [candidate division KSB1 bacterium]NIT70281.1 SDR family oxidoreductase [candidate division KSB1 bacterium]NIU24004.1 SDR family oxidoreductase [candidate division KSB1 bacterium]